jgi:hypothetical protein
MGLLYGRAGRLTALFGGFRPGQDVARVWEVLNPGKKSWIPFAEFVAGMIKVIKMTSWPRSWANFSLL